MIQCIVIADELTGGSAVGALLEKNHCKVCALMGSQALKEPAVAKFDCLVYSTNSRRLTPEQSYQLVFSATRLLRSPGVQVYAKRIDPSMRGNTCAETQAMLDALGDPDRVAVVVPAFPALGRSNVGGYMLVHGRQVSKSLAGLEDPRVAESGRVADLFTEKFHYQAEALHLKEYLKGPVYLASRIRELAAGGARALVMDCTSQEEVTLIADAVIASGIKCLAVDPGPFTATLARKIMRLSGDSTAEGGMRQHRIFGVVGGINPLIAAQMEMLKLVDNVLVVSVHHLELISDEHSRMAEISRVAAEISSHFDGYEIAFAASDNLGSANPKVISDFEDALVKTNRSESEALDLISSAYGEITRRVLEKRGDIEAVYTAGAEFTAAITRELKASGLKIQGQVLPLTAYGEMLGGNFNGLKCVTSASTATDANTITDSIQYLKRKLEV